MSRSRIDPAVVDEAAQWMALLQSGQMSAVQAEAFAAWRSADPEHEQVIGLMGGGFAALQHNALRQLSRDSLLHSLNAPSSRRRFIGSSLGLLGAALATGLLGRQLDWWPPAGALYTGVGERRSLTLDDGSALLLDAQTRVLAHFDQAQRHLELCSGELQVDVARDPSRPFVVQTEHGRMRALGTRFLVRRDEASTQLVMLHSQVEVLTANGTRQVATAGQSLRFDGQGLLALEAAKGYESAWTRGLLEARDRPLGEIVEQLRRYRRGILRVDPEVAGLRLSGLYPLDESDRTLQLLERSLPIRVRYHSPYWVSIEPRQGGL
ncbi:MULTISPECIES: FecR domain-containing protein [Pseudomonas]|uniref:FecR domain-containing protein n=1 Tax=Pseudomonas TaxID=286 RepID=UPI00069D943C|nr:MULTISPECIES: FecR family protein [Pseudomonas]AZC19309.1 Putative transmembrane sensor [Pseudomonas sp. CMR5c]MCU7647319.1 FecR family protein [Pseudomonas piscis]